MLGANFPTTPLRQFSGWVAHIRGATHLADYLNTDYLISAEVSRIGESKFFGFGVSQKLVVKLRDKARELDIQKGDKLLLYLSYDISTISNFPTFFVKEVTRDENSNGLTVTAYDALEQASSHYTSEIALEEYTLDEYAYECAKVIGVTTDAPFNEAFYEPYAKGVNLDGSETIREALNAIAEATQTIYYIDYDNYIVFKQLAKDGQPVWNIDRAQYFTLEAGKSVTLGAICSATELGDNLTASLDIEGAETQYIRDNPFIELKENLPQILEQGLAAIGGLTINEFKCKWRGNYLLEIGDKISLATKDGGEIISYVLNDVITYNGGLSQVTEWKYNAEEKSASNPTTLGDAIKNTYARVDKANKQIELAIRDGNATKDAVTALQLNTESISASVETLSSATTTALGDINGEMADIKKKVEATITEEQVTLQIENAISNGVDKVETATGFTFNEAGLKITKSDSEITTQITQDGMSVYKNDSEVLTANNEGVTAIDLHAKTYLVIGENSRLEDYGKRTACFWIGG